MKTGVVISVLGLAAGFGLLFGDLDRLALWVLAFVPAGFLLAFTGLVAALLAGDSGPPRGPED